MGGALVCGAWGADAEDEGLGTAAAQLEEEDEDDLGREDAPLEEEADEAPFA